MASVSGEIAIFDFELSKVEGYCVGGHAEGEISGIEFIVPYPIMVTSGMDG